MAGNVAVETQKAEVFSFPLSNEQTPVPSGLHGQTHGKDVDLYSKLKSLERQLEFLEIQVCGSNNQLSSNDHHVEVVDMMVSLCRRSM